MSQSTIMVTGGVLFKLNSKTEEYNQLFDFTSINGADPSSLIIGSDGFLYGTLRIIGGSTGGLIYKVDQQGSQLEIIHEFDWFNDGGGPSGLIQDSDGFLYGTTTYGGAASVPEGYPGNGTIYKIAPDGSNFQVLHDFSNEDGGNSEDLMIGNDDMLYGVTRGGGISNHGQVYKIAKDGNNFTILFEFDDTNSNTGIGPSSGLIEDSEGYLYGTFSSYLGEGIFKIKNDGTEYSILHSFDGSSGSYPENKLALGSDNTLYGSTLNGGTFNEGVAFSIKTDGSDFTKLYDFNNVDGENPKGQLIINELPIGLIEDVELAEDSDPFTIDLYDAFQDTETPDEFLEFEIIENSNPAIFSSIDILSGDITFSLEDNQFGSSTITLRCTDGIGDFVDTEFSIIVYPIFDAPSVTNTTTIYGVISSSGLVCLRNDDEQVTHFKISGIQNGILYQNDGETVINNQDFISIEEGAAGLKFLPTLALENSFQVQGSSSTSNDGLLGEIISSQIFVSKAPLSVNSQPVRITYGDELPVLEAVISGFVLNENEEDMDGTLSFEEIITTVAGEFIGAIVPTGLSSDNYQITFVPADLIIIKKPLNVSVLEKTIIYGDIPSFEVDFFGFVDGEDREVLNGTLSFDDTIELKVGQHENAIVPSGLTSNNYEINFTSEDLTINKKELTISAIEKNIFYGDDLDFDVTFDDFAFEEDETYLLGSLLFDNIGSTIFGEYPNVINPSGLTSDNYEINFVPANLTISKKPLSITANNESIVYGNELPTFSVDYSAFAFDESEQVLTGVLVFEEFLSGSAGEYSKAIVPSGLIADNYEILFKAGNLTINKEELSVAAIDKTITYGDDFDFEATISGFVFEENEDDLSGTLTFTEIGLIVAGGHSKVIIPIGLTSDNYEITNVPGDLTINKKELSVTAIDKTITYGDDFDFEAIISGFVFEENEDDLSGTLTFAEILSTVAGDYPKGIIPMGLSSDNYEIYNFSAELTINKKELFVTAQNESTPYGDAIPPFSVTYLGFAYNEDKLALTGVLEFDAILSTSAGEYSSVIIPSGLTAHNYEISFEAGDLSIDKKLLTATADDQTRKFGEENPILTLSLSGLVNDEKETDINVLPLISTPATATSDVGTYDIILEGGEDDNYELSLTKGTLSITKAEATISFSDLDQKVDGSEKSPEIATEPSGLNYTISFDGKVDLPIVVGDYEVTVEIDEQNYDGTDTETFSITQILAIAFNSNNSIYLYPNPSNEFIKIEGINPSSAIKVYNLVGKMVFIKNVNSESKIDVSQLNAGRYFIGVYNDSNELIKKISFIKTQ